MPPRNNATSAAMLRSAPSLDRSTYVAATIIAMGLVVAILGAGRTALPDANDAHRSLLLTKIDLNTASAAELGVLPSIGDALATRIVALRTERRERDDAKPVFRSAEDLDDVRGIGPKSIEKIRPFLSFHE